LRQLSKLLLSARAGIAVPVVVAGAVVTAIVVPRTWNACFSISGGKGFSITSIMTAYPSCSGPAIYLYPGVRRCLVYTAHNPLHVPITVSSLSISRVTLTTQPRDPALPACRTAELDLSRASFSGSLIVPALGTSSVDETITLIDTVTNQDNCEAATFNFVYSGAATYTDTTTTSLTSAPNPSKSGRTVTFIATVTPTGSPPSNPTGTVDFYLCRAVNCASTAMLGSVGIGKDGQATYSTPSLAVGTDLVEAVYKSPTTDFTGSTSALVSQVVQPTMYPTTTNLAGWPNPSAPGSPVTFTVSVAGPSRTGTPSGAVSFYSGTPTGPRSLLGTSSLDPNASVSFVTSALSPGTDSLYVIYGGDNSFIASTSPPISQVVVALPRGCVGTYPNDIFASPSLQVVDGTNGSDFIYAFGGNFVISGLGGNDCIWAGDGNNAISDGNGNDVVTVGDGSNTVVVGNGKDTIDLGAGLHNLITLGAGVDTVVVAGSGSQDTVNGGSGEESIYFGAGTYNTYRGSVGRTNVCHLPAPPTSYHGSPATYYHDTLSACTVVTS